MQPPRVAQGVDRRLYFLGFKENLREVFGSNFLLAMLPVATRSVTFILSWHKLSHSIERIKDFDTPVFCSDRHLKDIFWPRLLVLYSLPQVCPVFINTMAAYHILLFSLGDGVTYKTRSISGHVEMGVVTTGGQSSAESDADATETQPLTSQVQV